MRRENNYFIMGSKALNVNDILNAIRGLSNVVDLERVRDAVNRALHDQGAAEVERGNSLESLEDFEAAAGTLMDEWWTEDEATELMDNLMARAEENDMHPDESEVSEIMEAMGDASNARDDLSHFNKNDPDHLKYEKTFIKARARAIKLLRNFWQKWVDNKPTR